MPEYRYELKIPKGRVAVLIGKNGEVKKQIEEDTNTKLKVNSAEGDVLITGEDGLSLYNVKEVVTAVGRGFNPELAMLLLKADYSFEQINLKEYTKSPNHFIRMKGRIIGSEGKSRKLIEELSETHISVYGKTVAILGPSERVVIARRAIESLIAGSPHSTVYRWLEKKRKEIKTSTFMEI